MNAALASLLERVAGEFHLDPGWLLEPGRGTRTVSAARQVAIWLAWTEWLPRPSQPELARMFGRRCHRCVRDAVDFVELQLARGTEVGLAARRLQKKPSTPPPRLRVA